MFTAATVQDAMMGPSLAGKVTRHRSAGALALDYYLYVPTAGAEGAPVMVAVHGISRNARSQVRQFVALAERYGVVVVAPSFSFTCFPAYQRLGLRQGHFCSRPDQALHAVVEEVGELTGARTERISMFGYSGGGQFVHRYAMLHPERVQSVSMGAPGWYSFPDPERSFPWGVRTPRWLSQPPQLSEQLFQVPMAVFVGTLDKQRDRTLNTSTRIDAQQGLNRFERGRRWVGAMQTAAHCLGYLTRYQFQPLENCGHSFRQCMELGQMGSQVFDFMFGQIYRQGREAIRPISDESRASFVVFQTS